MKYYSGTAAVLLLLSIPLPLVNCGSYEIYIDYLEYPFGKKDQLFDYGTLRVTKFNRTIFVVDGQGELLQPITDDISVVATCQNKQANGNQYLKLGDIKFEKLCSYLKKDTTFYPDLALHSSIPPQDSFECPSLPAGKYVLKNYLIEENGFLPDYIPGTENWRNEIRFKKNNEIIGGINAYVIIRKKNPGKIIPF